MNGAISLAFLMHAPYQLIRPTRVRVQCLQPNCAPSQWKTSPVTIIIRAATTFRLIASHTNEARSILIMFYNELIARCTNYSLAMRFSAIQLNVDCRLACGKGPFDKQHIHKNGTTHWRHAHFHFAFPFLAQ